MRTIVSSVTVATNHASLITFRMRILAITGALALGTTFVLPCTAQELSEADNCYVKILESRGTAGDRCFAKCIRTRAGENVGGGCAHLCTAYGKNPDWLFPLPALKCYEATYRKEAERCESEMQKGIPHRGRLEWCGFEDLGEFARAAEFYSYHLRTHPTDPDALRLRGTARAHVGDFLGAVTDINASMRQNANLVRAYTSSVGGFSAEQFFRRALRNIEEEVQKIPALKERVRSAEGCGLQWNERSFRLEPVFAICP